MSIEIVEVPRLDKGAEAPPALADYSAMTSRQHMATMGDDDLADPVPMLVVAMTEQTYRRRLVVIEYDDGRAVGAAWLRLPLKDNLLTAQGQLVVDPAADPGVVLPALWDYVRARLVQEGRSIVHVGSEHRPAPDGDHRVPRTGVGQLPVDAMTIALESLGFELEQVERHNVLEVRPALEVAAAEGARALEVAGAAYRTLSWVGLSPVEHRDGLAVLMERLTTDAPLGQVQLEPEQWDAERVEESERSFAEMGMERLTTVAQHVGTGELVGFTQVDRPVDKPAVAYQEGTVVMREHRGHRLGMLVKTINLQLLAEHAPSVERIHTWNAGENDHMLAINVALGFRERVAEGAWQLTGL